MGLALLAMVAASCGVEVHSDGESTSTVYYETETVGYTVSRYDTYEASYSQLHSDCIYLDEAPASDTVYISDYIYDDEFAFTWSLRSNHLKLRMEEYGNLIHWSQYSYHYFATSHETEHKVVSSSGVEYLLTLAGGSCY